MATRSLAWLLTAVLCTVESAPDHASTGKSNLRDFYIMLAGIGPTQDGGGSVTDPASMWLRNTTWSSRYVTMSADWMVNASQISAARAVGWSITSTVHGSPRWCNRSGQGENLTHAMQMLTAAGIEGQQVLLEYITEDDSAGVGFPQDLLALARSSGYSNGATQLDPREASEAWADYIAEAYAATSVWPDAQRHARVGFAGNVHSVATVADVVLVEVANDDCGSFAPTPAFLRGAARQFNISWGVDLSLWWGVIDGCVEDLPASLHRRIMVLSYVAGAKIVSVEGCGWIDPRTGVPNQMAKEVDRFGSLVAKGLGPKQRGDPDVPVAMVFSFPSHPLDSSSLITSFCQP